MFKAIKIKNESTVQVTDWRTKRKEFHTVWQNSSLHFEDGITVFNGNEEDCQEYASEFKYNSDATSVQVLPTGVWYNYEKKEKAYCVVAYGMQIEYIELEPDFDS